MTNKCNSIEQDRIVFHETPRDMSRRYYNEADRLEDRRKLLLKLIKERPSAEELHSLEMRAELLVKEINEMRGKALYLSNADKKPDSPSLSARQRGCS